MFLSKVLTVLLFTIYCTSAQVWLDPFINRDDVKLSEIQSFAEAYFANIDTKQKGSGFKQYKRFEEFWKDRLMPDGTFPTSTFILEANKYSNQSINNKDNKVQGNEIWSYLGPYESTGGYSGLGRVNCIRKNPHNGDLWAGTPSGGVWVSKNNGQSWATNTDNQDVITSLGVTSIAFHPTNSGIVYIASGDGNGSNTYSLGILKSTNGGESWNTTGLSWGITQYRTISKLLVNPSQPQILLAAGSNGINKSSDGGDTWKQVKSGSFKDMEFKPGAPSTIYACGNTLWKSSDNGESWEELTNGIPNTGNSRIAIAVSNNNPNVLYALIGNSTGNNLKGVYLSTNSGVIFSEIAGNSPNMMGYAKEGDDTKGQTGYDLCIESDQSNWQKVIVGGINTWKSTNAGTDWKISSMWSGNHAEITTVHADQHDLWYDNVTNNLYLGNDGGVYKSTDFGDKWTWIGNGILSTQFYRFGISQLDSAVYIGGTQDNGTKVHKNDGTWRDAIGGDGFDAVVDHTNPNIMYGSLYNGLYYKSENSGNSFSLINDANFDNKYDDIDESGAWSTPFILNPKNNKTSIIGLKELWISNDGSLTFRKISNFDFGNNKQVRIAISISDTNVIYVAFNTRLYRTTNYGISWDLMTRPGNSNISYISIDENNPLKIWATNSNYSTNNKVFESEDGGLTWSNISKNLPNVPTLSIIKQKDTKDRLWIGTDIGVFYIDDEMTDWVIYNPGFPNVIVTEVEINYTHNQIFASTYGRGLWKADLPSTLNKPIVSDPALNSFGQKISNLLIDWNDIDNANKYVIQISKLNNFSNLELRDTLSVSRYIFAKLNHFTNYYVRVKALSDFSQSDWSNTHNFTTIVDRVSLISPTNNSFGKDTSEIISWSELDGATEYQLLLSSNDDFSGVILDTNLTKEVYKTYGLEYFKEYWFKVRGKDPSGIYGEWSFVRKFQTKVNKPILTSPIDMANNLNLSIKFEWSIVDSADNYIIQISKNTGFTDLYFNEKVNLNTKVINDLSPYTVFYWRVAAEKNSKSGDWSKTFSFNTKIEKLTLSNPSNNSINLDPSNIFNWEKANYAETYEFQIDLTSTFDGSNLYKSNFTNNNTVRNNLFYDTVYFWRARINTSTVSGEWSDIFNFRTKLKTPLLLEPNNEKIDFPNSGDLTWQVLASNSESRIQVAEDFNFNTTLINELVNVDRYTISMLSNDTKYYWRVRAERKEFNSDWSDIYSFNTTSTIDRPILISPSNNKTNLSVQSILMKWNQIEDADKYIIQISNNSDFNNFIINNSNLINNEYEFEISDYNQIYYWRVKATRKVGSESEWSEIWKFSTTLPAPSLKIPVNNSTEILLNSNLQWSEVSGAEKYNVEVSENELFQNNLLEMTKSITANELQFSNIDKDKTYYWRVNSENNIAKSQWSDVWNFKTVLNDITYVSDLENYGEIKVTPNPFDEFATIEIHTIINMNAQISVTNINGIVVREIANELMIAKQQYSYQFDKKELSSGVYFLNIKFNGINKSIKLIIN